MPVLNVAVWLAMNKHRTRRNHLKQYRIRHFNLLSIAAFVHRKSFIGTKRKRKVFGGRFSERKVLSGGKSSNEFKFVILSSEQKHFRMKFKTILMRMRLTENFPFRGSFLACKCGVLFAMRLPHEKCDV